MYSTYIPFRIYNKLHFRINAIELIDSVNGMYVFETEWRWDVEVDLFG